VVHGDGEEEATGGEFFSGVEERRGKGAAAARGGEGKGLAFWRRILVNRRGGSR
jgi:hypothetical protein